MPKSDKLPRTPEGERNPNRIRNDAEMSKLLEKINFEDIIELREIVFKIFDDDCKEAEAVMDWLLRGAPNYKMMQVRMALIIRSYFLVGVGKLQEGVTADEVLKARKDEAN